MIYPDLLAELIEESLPWFYAWAVLLGLILGGVVVNQIVAYAQRSPLDKLLRRRLG